MLFVLETVESFFHMNTKGVELSDCPYYGGVHHIIEVEVDEFLFLWNQLVEVAVLWRCPQGEM